MVYAQAQIQFMPSILANKTLLCLRTGQNVVNLRIYNVACFHKMWRVVEQTNQKA